MKGTSHVPGRKQRSKDESDKSHAGIINNLHGSNRGRKRLELDHSVLFDAFGEHINTVNGTKSSLKLYLDQEPQKVSEFTPQV